MTHPSEPLLAEARRYGYADDSHVWLQATPGQPARIVGLVKDGDAAAALTYFARRFADFAAKATEVLDLLTTADNPGSYLMKARHLRGLCHTHNGLGNYPALAQRLAQAEADVLVSVRHNRARNLAAKHELLAQTQVLTGTTDWLKDGELVKALRAQWLQTGPVDKDLTDDLEARFQAALQVFFDRRKQAQIDKKALASRALARYRELLAEAEQLQHSPAFETTSRQLKQLQLEWRDTKGSVNKKTAADLWTRFRAANNVFFERLKAHIEAQRLTDAGQPVGPDELLARKRRLTERIETLTRAAPAEAVPQAKLLQAEWKQVGTVRGEESDALWNRFMVACDRIFELSALEYFVRKSFNGQPETGPAAARAQARVTALIEFLAADHAELAQLQADLAPLPPLSATAPPDPARQQAYNKVRSLERKIRAKNDLLADFTLLAAG